MESADWIIGGIALAALVLGIVQAITTAAREKERDNFERRSTEEAVEIQRKQFEIEEQRHAWEQEERSEPAQRQPTDEEERSEPAQRQPTDEEERSTEPAQRQPTDEEEQTAGMQVRFAFRDSARTWARILATNYGPADARDVALAIHAESEGSTVVVEPIGGMDYGTAEMLQPSESVHVGVAFTFGSPQPEDLRYRLSWVDGRGEQERQGRVPID